MLNNVLFLCHRIKIKTNINKMCVKPDEKPDPIRHLLPRGVISKVAKMTELTWQSVYYVATGRLNRPDIYNLLLKEAMEAKKKEISREPLTKENEKLISSLELFSNK